MSAQRKITTLKFKTKSNPTHQPQHHPNPNPNPSVNPTSNPPVPPTVPDEDTPKTLAQKSYQIVKKKRLIQKAHDKAKESNKQRIEKWKKTLSKQSDHYDLAKIGEKIQKGY